MSFCSFIATNYEMPEVDKTKAKYITVKEAKYLQTKKLTYDIKDLPNVFCRLHNFEQLPYDVDVEVEFVIDTDTDRIYSLSD